MGLGGGAGVTGVAAQPISWLVSFNRLHSATALESALNKQPGQFVTIDLDRDGAPDSIAVRQLTHDGGPAFELQANPRVGDAKVVATLLFDKEWNFVGSYDGALPGATPVVTPKVAPVVAAGPSAAAPGLAARAPAFGGATDHAEGLAMQPISWLVKFNKLHSAKSLETALNNTPGEFSKVDTNSDGLPDYIVVSETSRDKGRAFELRARASTAAGQEGVLVATLMFDADWAMTGWYNGAAPQ
jgi:hypothetical protein